MRELVLFNRALKEANVDFQSLNNQAVKKGYIVHPSCCNTRVEAFLKTLPLNYGSTFYKSWTDVTSKTRTELAIDQILHYASTYGTGYQGKPYIPNSNPETINFTDCKVIMPITVQEIGEKIQAMFNSGIALKQETIEACLELVSELGITIDYSSVKNKEVMMFLCKKLDILPTSAEEMVRYLVYLYTEKTLLIKSPDVLRRIKSNPINVSGFIQRFGMEKLSSVFYRFKPLFLAMKKENESTINKLRKLAIVNHQPKQFGFWAQVLSDVSLFPKIQAQLVNLNNYKLVGLLQTILVRQKQTGIMPVLIRNGKLFVTERNFSNKVYIQMVYNVLYAELIARLSKKACKVKLDPGIELALPTSEKSFIGNIPFGSYVALNQDAIVGINWKGVDGADDLDLSLIDAHMNKIGWNSHYYNEDESVIYSGDMTYAQPEATELLYAKAGVPDSCVMVNLFNGMENSKYTLFFASCKNYVVTRNSMVDPNHIVFQTQLSLEGQNICGIFAKGKFFFMDFKFGGGRVSNGTTVTSNLIEHKSKTAECYLNLRTVLKEAGFEFVTENPDIDLSIQDKSLIIDLLKEG